MFLKKVKINLNVKDFVVSIIRHCGKVFDLDTFFEFFNFFKITVNFCAGFNADPDPGSQTNDPCGCGSRY
jgi:hypothetical protein